MPEATCEQASPEVWERQEHVFRGRIKEIGGEVSLLILGVDPGVIFTGYGIIKADEGELEALEYGTLEFGREFELPDRLESIYRRIAEICADVRPHALALEDVFFNKNVRTALTVGHVRGAVMLAALHNGLDVFTYTPLQIKQTVTGYGRANKDQVQRMV
ncbi:MAG: crossover junction endodeoxyribonuclease RuvC, partial [Thermacetogeniaceae bacterium]